MQDNYEIIMQEQGMHWNVNPLGSGDAYVPLY